MVKKFTLVCCLAFVTFYSGYAQSQSPKGINFQAVARQFDGRPIANKQISIRISIAEGSASGNKEYVEQQFPTTNPLGLFDLVIGQGNRISGEFNAVNWSTGNKWIQIEIDPNGGTNFIILGSQQMLTVPYAFFADRAANVIEYTGGAGIAINESVITNTGDDDSDPGNELISNVSLSDDHKLLITDAGGTFEVNLGKFANEPLSLGEVLSIGNDAGENTISNLSDPINDQDAATKNYVDNLDVRDDDADPTNEIQDLELISNLLRITNNLTASAIDLSVYLDNTDNQTLALDNNELSISNGNSVDLNKYLDNTDNQNLSLDQNQLSISDGNSVDLSIYLDNTDSQNLSLQASGTLRIINIDNGEGVEINVADNDNDPQNEIQDLVLSNNVLTITEKSNPTLIDLSPYLDNTDNQDLSIIADNLNISGGTGVSLSTYRQTLSASGTGSTRNLSISGGNTISLNIADNDNDPLNEIQDLEISNNLLSITGKSNPTPIDLSPYLDNTDNQDLSIIADNLNISGGTGVSLSTYRQTLSASGTGSTRNLSISGGNTISLNIADNDNDPLNEIQDLSLSGNTLTITGKANPNPINLSTYLDNTDNQNLSLGAISGTNRTINISNGASVTFSVADNDNSSTNEAQTLTRTGSLIILSQVSGVGGGNFFLNDMQGATISNVGYPFSPSDAATKQYVDERLVILSPIAQMSANADGISTTHSPSTFAFKVGTSFNGSASNSRVNLVRSLTGFDEAGQINQNRFSAQQDGIYQFTINASSTDPNATLKVSINGAVVSEVMKINTGVFQENLFFKLNTNDYLEFLIDQNSNGNLTGTFFGFKL